MSGGFQNKPGGSTLVQRKPGAADAIGPGKLTLTEQLPVQRRADGSTGGADVHQAAAAGLQGSAQSLPHLDAIQRSFGPHDVRGVHAFVGGPAAEASRAMGASAYATGNSTAFASAPDLHTAAHEAAHVVQQRAGVHLLGGVGQEGDAYEKHADAVADLVVQGKSASAELDRFAPGGAASGAGHAVQRNAPPAAAYPKIVTIGTEKVNVASAEEEKEAQGIIASIKTDFGIDLSSQTGVDAIKKQYTNVPKAVTDKLATKEWELKELRALKRALAHFSTILGKNRASSTRKDAAQELTTGSKVDHGIDTNTASGALDNTTMGEFFQGSNNFSMFTAGTNFTGQASVGIFKDNETNLEANATHELAHGLCRYAEPDFIKEMDYWTDVRTKSGKAGAEEPVTPYGKTNAREDLAEAVKFYFLDAATLLSKCPKRHGFVKKLVESWTPKADKK